MSNRYWSLQATDTTGAASYRYRSHRSAPKRIGRYWSLEQQILDLQATDTGATDSGTNKCDSFWSHRYWSPSLDYCYYWSHRSSNSQ